MKSKSKWIFLPRRAIATKTFAAVKILLSLLFLISLLGEIFWTFYTMRYFLNLIDEDDDTTKDNLVYRTHAQFFLFTGLYVIAAYLIGFTGILKESISAIYSFIVLAVISMLFEGFGAYRSKSEDVIKLKLMAVSVDPALIVLGVLFVIMVKNNERRLANLPVFRQTMAESRRNSLDKIPENIVIEHGRDNPVLDLSDEKSVNAHHQQQSKRNVGIAGDNVTGGNFLNVPNV